MTQASSTPEFREREPFIRALAHAAAGRKAVWQAHLGRRLAASLTDLLAFSPAIIAAVVTYARWSGNPVHFPAELAWYDALAVTFARHVGFVLGFCATAAAAFGIARYVWVALFDRTPGMRLLRLDFWTPALNSPGPLRLLVRESIMMVSMTFFAAGILWAIFDESHRPLADVAAGIYLVDAEPRREGLEI